MLTHSNILVYKVQVRAVPLRFTLAWVNESCVKEVLQQVYK